MNQFSISQLSSYAGVKPHTIRVWEQRYDALAPNRSKGNTRYYDSMQLRRLLNIVSLMDGDHKISELCGMSDERLFRLVNDKIQNIVDETGKAEYFISQMIAAGMSYDEQHFEKMLSNCLIRYGIKKAYTDVLYPMLDRIGLMWAGNNIPPANEHFISNMLKQKLFTAIDSLPPAKPSTDKWLLFLKEDEFHEIGLLLACYLIRLSGRQVIYLGPDVPFSSVAGAITDTAPQYLLLFLVHFDLPQILEKYFSKLSTSFKGRKIFVCGNAHLFSEIKLANKIQWIKSVDELENELAK